MLMWSKQTSAPEDENKIHDSSAQMSQPSFVLFHIVSGFFLRNPFPRIDGSCSILKQSGEKRMFLRKQEIFIRI